MAFPEDVTLREARTAGAVPEPRRTARIWGTGSHGWQGRVADSCESAFRFLQRVARHKLLVCVAMAVLPMGIRFAALPWKPIPTPAIHDEFSYILAADTFRSGRLTNPTHPMWRHFETFHELMQPTYQSKYPPAQGMFLALGWKLMGHPWYGVWISFGFMCGCLCWMLQGWVPPVYGVLGTLLAIAQIRIFGYWMDSYWGGAVAAAGGALVIGALPRLTSRPNFAASILGAVGVAILANSRPYEGGVMVAAAALALLWWRRRRNQPFRQLLSWRNLVPFLVIGGCTLAWMAYYNYRVTGDALTMPYAVYWRTYAVAPNWWMFPPNHHTEVVHQPALRDFSYGWEFLQYLPQHLHPLNAVYRTVEMAKAFYFPAALCLAIGAALLAVRSPKVWLPAGLIAVVLCGNVFETWHFAHYIACALGLGFIIAASALRMLRTMAGRFGAAMVFLCVAIPEVSGLGGIVSFYVPPDPRPDVIRSLKAHGGKHLVIVRYAPQHKADVDPEWVFNAADIDRSPIVWARDMGVEKNRELLSYYPDRKAWLLRPDQALIPTPYSETVQ